MNEGMSGELGDVGGNVRTPEENVHDPLIKTCRNGYLYRLRALNLVHQSLCSVEIYQSQRSVDSPNIACQKLQLCYW